MSELEPYVPVLEGVVLCKCCDLPPGECFRELPKLTWHTVDISFASQGTFTITYTS